MKCKKNSKYFTCTTPSRSVYLVLSVLFGEHKYIYPTTKLKVNHHSGFVFVWSRIFYWTTTLMHENNNKLTTKCDNWQLPPQKCRLETALCGHLLHRRIPTNNCNGARRNENASHVSIQVLTRSFEESESSRIDQ